MQTTRLVSGKLCITVTFTPVSGAWQVANTLGETFGCSLAEGARRISLLISQGWMVVL